MSKPVLYVFGGSVWAAVPELAVAELYSDGEVEAKVVNLVEGENFNPSFIKLNSDATLPTLHADGNVYTSTKDVTYYLVSNSKKAPKATKPELIDLLHEDKYDPNFALLLARNDQEIEAKGDAIVRGFLSGRQVALEKYSGTPEGEEFKAFYDKKKTDNGGILAIYEGKVPQEIKEGFFSKSQAHFDAVKLALTESIPPYLPHSGFIDGSEPGETDFHMAAWLTRIVATVGGTTSENGLAALETAYGKPVPEKVAAYWQAWTVRPSWKKVYGGGLH